MYRLLVRLCGEYSQLQRRKCVYQSGSVLQQGLCGRSLYAERLLLSGTKTLLRHNRTVRKLRRLPRMQNPGGLRGGF